MDFNVSTCKVSHTYTHKIFNLSISKGKFIDVLKIVKVVSVFKNKRSPLETGNYRPISLLSNVDKIYEKIMHKRMISYLEAKNILIRSSLDSDKRIQQCMVSFA